MPHSPAPLWDSDVKHSQKSVRGSWLCPGGDPNPNLQWDAGHGLARGWEAAHGWDSALLPVLRESMTGSENNFLQGRLIIFTEFFAFKKKTLHQYFTGCREKQDA